MVIISSYARDTKGIQSPNEVADIKSTALSINLSGHPLFQTGDLHWLLHDTKQLVFLESLDQEIIERRDLMSFDIKGSLGK